MRQSHFPLCPSQSQNRSHVGSAYDKIRSAHAEHIMKVNWKLVAIHPYAEHTLILICTLLAEHTRKLVPHRWSIRETSLPLSAIMHLIIFHMKVNAQTYSRLYLLSSRISYEMAG